MITNEFTTFNENYLGNRVDLVALQATNNCVILLVGYPTIPRRLFMTELINEYDAKIDTKRRITLRDIAYEYFHIKQYKDGTMVLEPRVLVEPDAISKKSLKMMDKSISNYKKGKVSKTLDLSAFSDK